MQNRSADGHTNITQQGLLQDGHLPDLKVVTFNLTWSHHTQELEGGHLGCI